VPYLNLLRRESDGSCIYIAALTPPSTVRALPRAPTAATPSRSSVRRSAVEIAVQGHTDLPFYSSGDVNAFVAAAPARAPA